MHAMIDASALNNYTEELAARTAGSLEAAKAGQDVYEATQRYGVCMDGDGTTALKETKAPIEIIDNFASDFAKAAAPEVTGPAFTLQNNIA